MITAAPSRAPAPAPGSATSPRPDKRSPQRIRRHWSPATVVAALAEILPSEGRHRDGEFTAIAAGLCRLMTRGSFPDIGHAMGTTHPTVMTALRRWEEWNEDCRRAWQRAVLARLPEPVIALAPQARTWDGLVAVICELYDIGPAELTDGTRMTERLMLPRRLLAWCGCAYLDMMVADVAGMLHIDASYASKAVEHMARLVRETPGMREEARSIAAAIGADASNPRTLPALNERIEEDQA